MFFAQDDKRGFKRFALNMPIEISKESVMMKGICEDLSSTGMLITFTDAGLQANDEVHIRLDSADTRFPPLDAQATLLRIDSLQVGFSAALEFTCIK